MPSSPLLRFVPRAAEPRRFRRPAAALRALLLFLPPLFVGCGPVEPPTLPTGPAALRLSTDVGLPVASATPDGATDATLRARRLRERLERAAAGLLYTSESDHPFTWVSAPAPVDGAPLDEAAFRAAFGVAADVPVEVIGLDAFFHRHIEGVDPGDAVAVRLVPRYRRLREVLRRGVGDVRVYRVGRIAIGCFVVGTSATGEVVGLATVAIET